MWRLTGVAALASVRRSHGGVRQWRVSIALLANAPLVMSATSMRGRVRHCATVPPPPHAPAASAAAEGRGAVRSEDAYAPWEVRALVLPLLPIASTLDVESAEAAHKDTANEGVWPREVTSQLPRALQRFLNKEAQEKFATALLHTQAKRVTYPLTVYVLHHFPDEVVELSGGKLARRPPKSAETGVAGAASSAAAPLPTTATTPPPPPPPPRSGAASTPAATTTTTAAGNSSSSSSSMAPPPPPLPQGSHTRYAPAGTGGVVPPGVGAHPVGSTGPAGGAPSSPDAPPESDRPVVLRSVPQIMDAMAPFIPTFFTAVDAVEVTLPRQLQELYADSTFGYFLKRFRHYVDLRASHGSAEVRLRPDFDHPQRGHADSRFAIGGYASLSGAQAAGQPMRRPPRTSEANLIGLVAPQVPKEYTPLADVLQELGPIISRHPAFDARLGVMGLLGKYPEYFQLARGKLRARPHEVAPNALDSLDAATSPLPRIFERVWAIVEEAAAGKDYSVAEEKAAAAVSTGRLYGLLTPHEKTQVKVECRSFPTFLRLHGKALVVSVDKMRVHKFIKEYEPCVDTLVDERLRSVSLRPDDPILQIPVEMAPEAKADWAVQQFYDALPLLQCAELEEVLSLVPPAVRDGLPLDVAAVQALLDTYPDYFTTWRYPDDTSIVIVQRAKVEQPELARADIVRMVLPLIPQGGTTLTSLRTRVPLTLQRYFHRHGTATTLGAMKDVFAIAGDRIVRIA